MADEEHTQQLTLMMAEIATKVQVLLDKHDELADNITKIKEAVYNPDEGLYARLTRLDGRLDALEEWKDNNTKLLWIIITVGTGIVSHALWQIVF